jgi:hypothetical protein
MLRALFLGMLLLAIGPAEGGKKSRSNATVDAGFAPAKGKRVRAPWGRYGKRYPGEVVNQYGKFVEVKFDDGYVGWCAGDMTDPPIEPLPTPSDKNPWTTGQRVMAKWSLKGWLEAAVVDTYGDLTLVNFESEDRAWVRSNEVRNR